MPHDPPPLNYRPLPPVVRVRPRKWLSHMITAAALCLFALFVDSQLRFDAWEAGRVAKIEIGLAIYGSACALVSLARGALTRADKAGVIACLLLFAFTAFVGALMPRVIHN